jgi:hypothetical protein
MRRITIATVAGASLLLMACGGGQNPSASPSATPGDSVEQSASSLPSDQPSASSSVAATTGELLEGFHLDDILRVEVNGLAARTGPYTNMPLTTGWTWNGSGYDSIGDVRLNVGDFVSVELGPVKIGDTTWYRVWPAEAGVLHYSTVIWNANGVVDGHRPAWVAAAVGTDVYLTLHEASHPEPWMSGLPLLVAGTGNYISGPLQSTDLFTLDWVYLIDDQLAPCDFRVALGAVGGGEEVVAVDASTTGAFEEGGVGLGKADGTPVAGEGVDPFELRVASGCEWTLRLEPQPHD